MTTSLIRICGKQCKLAVGSIENIVACGTVYERIEPNEAIHMVPLGESNVRVSVEVVIQKDAHLPIPIPDEMLIVGEAVGFFCCLAQKSCIDRC
ncbi:unnamed protein product [Camellia sinensis]